MQKLRWLRLVCLTGFLGSLVGGGVYLLWAVFSPQYSVYIPVGSWELVAPSPSSSVQLLAYHDGKLFLQSRDGAIVACDLNRSECSIVPYVPESPIRFCGEAGSLRPFAPGKIVSSLAIRDCYPDAYVDTHFVVVEDGSIWKWQRWWSQNEVHLRLAAWAIQGATVAALTSIIVLWRRRKQLARTDLRTAES
jgi:hypothetical protein